MSQAKPSNNTQKVARALVLFASLVLIAVSSFAQAPPWNCNKVCRERWNFKYGNGPDCWVFLIPDCYWCHAKSCEADDQGCPTCFCVESTVEDQFYWDGTGGGGCVPVYSEANFCGQLSDDEFPDGKAYICKVLIS